MPFQFLGTSGAVPSVDRDNTALAFYSKEEVVLVDCSGSPYQRILKAGLDPMKVSSLIVTHAHVDHVYAVPSLAHNMGLAWRRATLHIYALAETTKVIRELMELFPLEKKMQYHIELHEVPAEEGCSVLLAKGFRILSTPVKHALPAIGLRVEFDVPGERGVVVFSGDNSPCASLVALARDADILIHEATRLAEHRALAAAEGHTTALQAGEIGRQAGARRLILCHFAIEVHECLEEVRHEAMLAYGGPVELSQEFCEYRI